MNNKRRVIARRNLPAAWETPILATVVGVLMLRQFPQPMWINVIAVGIGFGLWFVFLLNVRNEKEVDVLGNED